MRKPYRKYSILFISHDMVVNITRNNQFVSGLVIRNDFYFPLMQALFDHNRRCLPESS